MTQEKLSELAKLSSDAKNSFSELVSAFGTHLMCVCVSRTWNHMISGWKPYKLCIVCVHCVLTLWVCLSVHIACVCVVFCLFYWFIGPHQSFTTLDEIVCFCHYKQDQNMPAQTSTVVVSHRSPSRLYLFFFSFFLRQWMWIVEVCAHVTASLLLAEHIECEWKKTVAIHHAYLCLFCCRSQACPSEKVQSWSLEKAQRK